MNWITDGMKAYLNIADYSDRNLVCFLLQSITFRFPSPQRGRGAGEGRAHG